MIVKILSEGGPIICPSAGAIYKYEIMKNRPIERFAVAEYYALVYDAFITIYGHGEPSWSCDLDQIYILYVPLSCLRLHMKFGFKSDQMVSEEKIFENVDTQQ